MDLTPYISRLQRELAVAAATGGADAQELAERLTGPLESATRLVLLEALSTAAGEITLELEGATVDVRLRGIEPEIVVTQTTPPQAQVPTRTATADSPSQEDSAQGTARFSLRLPERLKPRLEQAAETSGISVNAWLVRTISAALDHGDSPLPRRPEGPRTGGWVR